MRDKSFFLSPAALEEQSAQRGKHQNGSRIKESGVSKQAQGSRNKQVQGSGARYKGTGDKRRDQGSRNQGNRNQQSGDRSQEKTVAVWGIPKESASPAVLVTAYRPDPERWSGDFNRRNRIPGTQYWISAFPDSGSLLRNAEWKVKGLLPVEGGGFFRIYKIGLPYSSSLSRVQDRYSRDAVEVMVKGVYGRRAFSQSLAGQYGIGKIYVFFLIKAQRSHHQIQAFDFQAIAQ